MRAGLIVALALVPALFAAGDGPLDRATLRGLKTVSVVVDPLDPELQKEGLSATLLQRQVEQRLQRAGIAVDANAVDFVGLRILGAQAKRTSVALSIDLGVYQAVVLVRDKQTRTATETWAVRSVVLSPPKQVSESSSETVDQLVQQLVTAYRAVNPQ
jgi:hypothetical protein